MGANAQIYTGRQSVQFKPFLERYSETLGQTCPWKGDENMSRRKRDHLKALETVLETEEREWVIMAIQEEIRQLKEN